MREIDIQVKTEPYSNHDMSDYINNLFKRKNSQEICTRMTITFYNEIEHIRTVINGYNSNDVQIIKIDFYPSFHNVFKMYYLYDDLKWHKSKIRNQDIIEILQNFKTYICMIF